jgi:hypothetical protein
MPATTSMASAARWIDLIRPVAISIVDISFPRPVWPHRTILADAYAEAVAANVANRFELRNPICPLPQRRRKSHAT